MCKDTEINCGIVLKILLLPILRLKKSPLARTFRFAWNISIHSVGHIRRYGSRRLGNICYEHFCSKKSGCNAFNHIHILVCQCVVGVFLQRKKDTTRRRYKSISKCRQINKSTILLLRKQYISQKTLNIIPKLNLRWKGKIKDFFSKSRRLKRNLTLINYCHLLKPANVFWQILAIFSLFIL